MSEENCKSLLAVAVPFPFPFPFPFPPFPPAAGPSCGPGAPPGAIAGPAAPPTGAGGGGYAHARPGCSISLHSKSCTLMGVSSTPVGEIGVITAKGSADGQSVPSKGKSPSNQSAFEYVASVGSESSRGVEAEVACTVICEWIEGNKGISFRLATGGPEWQGGARRHASAKVGSLTDAECRRRLGDG